MGMCNNPDIFQEKISELFVVLDTLRVYINNLLHVIKGSWTEHITFLEEMFTQIQKAGLKFNARNYALGPTNLTTRVITSLVTGLCPYQRNLRQFKPSQFPKKTQTIASVYRYDQLLPLHVEKELWSSCPINCLNFQKRQIRLERQASKVFWCYQTCDRTWSIVGLPGLQCSVWNTY